jgi:hypothetical protein
MIARSSRTSSNGLLRSVDNVRPFSLPGTSKKNGPKHFESRASKEWRERYPLREHTGKPDRHSTRSGNIDLLELEPCGERKGGATSLRAFFERIVSASIEIGYTHVRFFSRLPKGGAEGTLGRRNGVVVLSHHFQGDGLGVWWCLRLFTKRDWVEISRRLARVDSAR